MHPQLLKSSAVMCEEDSQTVAEDTETRHRQAVGNRCCRCNHCKERDHEINPMDLCGHKKLRYFCRQRTNGMSVPFRLVVKF